MRWYRAVVSAVLLSGISARAAIVFTDMQSGSTTGCGVFGSTATIACAAAFTPSADYTITDAQVKVEALPAGGDALFDLFLYSDSSGLPDAIIGSFGIGNAPATFGIVTLAGPTFSVVSGTQYWLVVGPHDTGSALSWSDGGSPAPAGAVEFFWPGGSWFGNTASSQFQLDAGSNAPEPAALGTAAAGVLLLAWRRRRARR